MRCEMLGMRATLVAASAACAAARSRSDAIAAESIGTMARSGGASSAARIPAASTMPTNRGRARRPRRATSALSPPATPTTSSETTSGMTTIRTAFIQSCPTGSTIEAAVAPHGYGSARMPRTSPATSAMSTRAVVRIAQS